MTKRMRYVSLFLAFVCIFLSLYFIFLNTGYEPKPPKNIIIMLFDTVRADKLTPYGFSSKSTPFIAELFKEEGIIFSNAYSQASSTLPSVASYFTGMYMDFHGAMTPRGYVREDFVTLAEYLKANGYATFGFIHNPWITREKKFDQGFNFWSRLDDNQITDYTISALNADNLNFITIKYRNQLVPVKKSVRSGILKRLSFNESHTTANGFKLINSSVRNEERIVLGETKETLDATKYHWGAAVRCSEKARIILELSGEDDRGERLVLASREESVTKDWYFIHHVVDLKRKYKNVRISISFSMKDGRDRSVFYIDDIFMINHSLTEKDRPRFLYLHYLTPHSPHRIPDETRGKLADTRRENLDERYMISNCLSDNLGLNNGKYLFQTSLFRGWQQFSDNISVHLNAYYHELRYCDLQVQRVVDYLKKTGQFDDTLLIVVSDHGEEFLDHGFLDHALTAYNECIHIPILMSYPASFPTGVEIDYNIASVDLYPTIIDLVNPGTLNSEAMKQQIQGVSLIPVIHGEKDLAERIIYSSDYFMQQTAAVYKRWKMISLKSKCYNKEVLFDLYKDRSESVDIKDENKKVFDMLRSAIGKYRENAAKYGLSEQSEVTTNPKLAKSLARLGYIGIVEMSRKNFRDTYCRYKKYMHYFRWLVVGYPL